MSKLVLYKDYLRKVFYNRYDLSDVTRKIFTHLTGRRRTTLSTFWLMYLSAYVNELAVPRSETEKERRQRLEDRDPYRGSLFNGLTLTYSTVGELPAEVNYYFKEKSGATLNKAQFVFASYMVLLSANENAMVLHVGVDRGLEKSDIVSSFIHLTDYLKAHDPENPLFHIFDACVDAVRENESHMLSFDLEKVIETYWNIYGVDLAKCGLRSVEFSAKMEGEDIYKLLMEAETIYPEDLLFFETELETSGNYDYLYIKKCKDLIEKRRSSKRSVFTPTVRSKDAGSVLMNYSDLSPYTASFAEEESKENRIQRFYKDVKATRNTLSKNFEQAFKSVISKAEFLTPEFIRENASFFKPREFNILLTDFDMGEEFLEQYFDSLDPVVIACHQHFSEAFFMKHFSKLNYVDVLKKGVNDWRLKENRSSKLSVFLRLKGIQD